jgi:hydrocephalus-inducing protein
MSVGAQNRSMMTLSSPTGGEYSVPLLARCKPPKPQGPYDFNKGTTSIPFRNIFAKSTEFTYSVDNPAFTVKPKDIIPAKTSTEIAVAYKGELGKGTVGRLTVSCPSEGCPPWIFYLKAA